VESEKREKPNRIETLAALNKHHLMMAGYSAADILGLGDLGELTKDRMHELIHTKNLEAMKETAEALRREGVKTKIFRKRARKKKKRVVRKVARRRTRTIVTNISI